MVCGFSTGAHGQTHSDSLVAVKEETMCVPPSTPHPRFPMKGLDAPVAPTLVPVPGVLVMGFTAASTVICTPVWTPTPGASLSDIRVRAVPMGSAWREGPLTIPGARVPSSCHEPRADCTWPPNGQWSSWQCVCTLRQLLVYGDQLGISPNFEKEGLLGNNRALDLNPQEAGN